MYKKRTDIIKILEHLGETRGKFPDNLSQKDIEELKEHNSDYYDCLNRYPINKEIKQAYEKRDNNLLMKNLYILMGYHIFEKIGKYRFGSPTFLWLDLRLDNLEWDIKIFLRMFIEYNGGNYYVKEITPYSNSLDKPYEKLFQKIKNRNLKTYFDEIDRRNQELKKETEKTKIREREYRDWLLKQEWYPELKMVNQTKLELDNNKRVKEDLMTKLVEIKTSLINNREQKIKLNNKLTKQKFNLDRKKKLCELKDKPSSEIINFLLNSKEPLDVYEPLSSHISIKDIQNLSNDLIKIFEEKVAKTNKKSGFRKLLSLFKKFS